MCSIVAVAAVGVFAATAAFAGTAAWAECPAGALGTARTLTVDPTRHGRVGTMQYARTLPLAEKEVVLTFDDGPLPPYSDRVLNILAAECAKATFFIVGQQARQFPDLVRRAYDEGHTVATHTENHLRGFDTLPASRVAEEIDGGIAWTAAALGDKRTLAPFFRAPGLRTSAVTEIYLASRAMMVWSADLVADDWRHVPASEVVWRALERLEAKGKGVLLLHDIQPATVLALPHLLKELKARGFRIVHVVPSDQPKAIVPGPWANRRNGAWPRIVEAPAQPHLKEPRLEVPHVGVASRPSLGMSHPFGHDIGVTNATPRPTAPDGWGAGAAGFSAAGLP
jgi:peptidoglycan/xylan/chitin deacetylase (PgdA/CDA1 family)